MATKKAGGTAKNLKDSQPKYLGTKLYDGEWAKPGSVIVRQRGSVIRPGTNVKMGKDHTLFSVVNGVVKFGSKRKTGFDNKTRIFKNVSVIPQAK